MGTMSSRGSHDPQVFEHKNSKSSFQRDCSFLAGIKIGEGIFKCLVEW